MDSVGFWSPVLEDSSLDALLEPLRAVLGSRLGRLEAILGRLASWAVLNRSWAILAALVACLGQVAVILDSSEGARGMSRRRQGFGKRTRRMQPSVRTGGGPEKLHTNTTRQLTGILTRLCRAGTAADRSPVQLLA